MDFKISDIVGKKSSFKLAQLDNTEIFLEPATAGKMLTISTKIGNIEELLAKPSAQNLSQIAMSLLSQESRKHFIKRKVTIFDLDGSEKDEEKGGYLLLMDLINGIDEQLSIYVAVLVSFGWAKDKAEELAQNYKDAINGMMNSQKTNEDVKKKETD